MRRTVALLGSLAIVLLWAGSPEASPPDKSVFACPEHFDRAGPLLTFVCLSDTHVIAGKPTATIQKAIADINRLEPRPRFAVVAGDLIDGERPKESMALCAKVLSGLHCPWFPVLGNHDSRQEFLELLQRRLGHSLPKKADSGRGPGDANYSFDFPPYHLIVLDDIDATAKDTYGGSFPEATIAWLKEHLQMVNRETPILVFSHASVFTKSPMSKELPGDVHRFEPAMEMLKPYHVVAWFAGHAHADSLVRKDGVDYITVGSLSDNRSNHDGSPGYCLVTVYKDRVETCWRSSDQFVSPIVVSQDDSGDFHGADEKPIRQAIEEGLHTGRRVLIGPGTYMIRSELCLKSGTTLVGTPDTILKLPPPTLVQAAAKKGDDHLVVDDASAFAPDTVVLIRPPREGEASGSELEWKASIVRIDGKTLSLSEPLAEDVPEKSGVGYGHDVLSVTGSQRDITLKDLVIDGGRREGIVMPGHGRRCAILAQGAWSYQNGPSAPPVENLRVLHCRIRNCYGRAVAFYSVANSCVEGCQIENIADEGIDLDHFSFGIQVRGNSVRHAVTGVTINDGSYCAVEGNCFADCDVGVTIWWWRMCPQKDIDTGNVIHNNVVIRPKQAGIAVGKRCFWNEIVGNVVEGGVSVAEPQNVVEDNR